MASPLRTTLLLLLLAFGLTKARAADTWQVIKVGGRDYLTLENVARFYNFPPEIKVTGRTVRIASAKHDLQLVLDGREAIIDGVRNWFSFPVISHDGHFCVSRVDLSKTLDPQFRPHTVATLGPIKTIVLDAGHGGHDRGICSSYGCEKDYALDVVKQLKPIFEQRGYNVVLTRSDDTFIPLEERARIANGIANAIFVSIHFNATDGNRDANGFEIYSLTPRGAPSTYDEYLQAHFFNEQNGSPVDNASHELATSIYHSILGHMSEFDRGIKRARFAVLRLTKLPAVLVEGGFMTERTESQHIAQREWRSKYADAIATGVENFKTLAETKQRPMLLADYRKAEGATLLARNGPAVLMGSQLAAKPAAEHEASPPPEQPQGGPAENQPQPAAEAPATSADVPPANNDVAAATPPTPEAAVEQMPADNSPPAPNEQANPQPTLPEVHWWTGPFKFQP